MNHNQTARLAFQEGDLNTAVRHFQLWLKCHPQDTSAHHDLAASFYKSGDLESAEKAAVAAVKTDDQYAQGWATLATIQARRGQIGTPIKSLLNAVRCEPNNHVYRVRLGMMLLNQGHFEQAMKTFLFTLKHEPDHIDAIAGMATTLERQGKFKDARAVMEPYIHKIESHAGLAATWGSVCRHLGEYQQGIDVLLRMLKGREPSAARTVMLTELGTLYDKIGAFDDAFKAHSKANQERVGTWDPDRLEQWVDRLINTFDENQFPRRPVANSTNDQPILIVGMPRSGTSLVEQILSAHPDVHGCGELEDVRITTLFAEARLKQPWPECIDALDQNLIDSLGDWYIKRRQQDASGCRWTTDKMPQNFQYLGWVSMLIPGVRIIHCIRDPMDTILSCYFQGFKSPLAWSNRLDWSAHYYRQYQRIMQHWERVLPSSMYTLHYETLVAQPETSIRSLLEYCSIPFHPSVLKHHESDRVVATASYAQANRPIYTSSAGKSVKYERHLQVVKNILEAK